MRAALRADAVEQQRAEPAHPHELPADHVRDGAAARLRGRAHSHPDAALDVVVRLAERPSRCGSTVSALRASDRLTVCSDMPSAFPRYWALMCSVGHQPCRNCAHSDGAVPALDRLLACTGSFLLSRQRVEPFQPSRKLETCAFWQVSGVSRCGPDESGEHHGPVRRGADRRHPHPLRQRTL